MSRPIALRAAAGDRDGRAVTPDATEQRQRRRSRSDRGTLRLQERDDDLLLTLFDNQAMARGQIEAVFFSSTARCNARLKQLLDAGYLVRHYLPVPPGTSVQGLQAIYTPGRNAYPRIALRRELPLAEVRKRSRADRSPLYLTHTLEIVRFRILLTQAVERNPDWTLDLWLGEQDTRHEYDLRAVDNGQGRPGRWRREVFRPDGFARLVRTGVDDQAGQDEERSFFIEIDLGHTSSREWTNKLRTHHRYGESGLFTEVYGGSAFQTLVVTTSARRRDNLRQIAVEEGTGFSRFSTFADEEAAGLLGPCWYLPEGGEEPVPLV